ncbi:MAG: hypothetical protein AAGI91_07620 [Bacteroidota bacterium]
MLARFRFSFLLFLVALLSPLVGCSDAFDPFVESDQTFALYGFLDARAGTQFVRLQLITARAEGGSTDDARVTSTDLTTGATLAWRDSLALPGEGASGTVFVADFQPVAGRAYRIEAVRRTGGAATTAEVRLPSEPALRPDDPDVFNEVVSQVLRIETAEVPGAIAVTYTVRAEGAEPRRFDVAYDTAEPVDAGFGVLLSLSRDAGTVLSSFEPGAEVELLALEIAYDVVDGRAAPVTGGLGLVGAAARFTSRWTLAPGIVEALGFVDAQGAK